MEFHSPSCLGLLLCPPASPGSPFSWLFLFFPNSSLLFLAIPGSSWHLLATPDSSWPLVALSGSSGCFRGPWSLVPWPFDNGLWFSLFFFYCPGPNKVIVPKYVPGCSCPILCWSAPPCVHQDSSVTLLDPLAFFSQRLQMNSSKNFNLATPAPSPPLALVCSSGIGGTGLVSALQ
jgi:hypothetical protein